VATTEIWSLPRVTMLSLDDIRSKNVYHSFSVASISNQYTKITMGHCFFFFKKMEQYKGKELFLFKPRLSKHSLFCTGHTNMKVKGFIPPDIDNLLAAGVLVLTFE